MDQRETTKWKKLFNWQSQIYAVQAELNDPKNMTSSAKLAELYKEASEKQTIVENLYTRWEELETKKAFSRKSGVRSRS